MIRLQFLSLLFLLSFVGCIQDDFVADTIDPVLRITTSVDSISINSSFQFEAAYFNNVGVQEAVDIAWSSSDEAIISIDNSGLAQANALGQTLITASYNNGQSIISDVMEANVGQTTVSAPEERSGMISTTSSYALSGDFTLKEVGNNLVLEFASNYQASSALPGLYVYLTNNRNTISNAYEIAAVNVFNGQHSYTIPNVKINDYSYVLYFCKPFTVKVGDGKIL
ncbi:MAG: hypothetical protein AB8G15_17535 [Saprospiraceae bacterium]